MVQVHQERRPDGVAKRWNRLLRALGTGAAMVVAGEPAPSAPGLTETCRATGLASGTNYRAAMRFGTDRWWSPLSNVVTFTTIAAPPAWRTASIGLRLARDAG